MRFPRLFRPPALIGAALLPLAAAVNAAPTVYVPLGSGNTVAVIDASADRVVGTIPNVTNAHGLAATADGARLVAGSLSEREPGQTPAQPEGMAESEHQAHHSQEKGARGKTDHRGTLYLLDGDQRRIRHKVPVPAAIHHNAVTPDGAYAVSTHPGRDGISVVDLERRQFLEEIATGPQPNYVVASPSGDRLFVSNRGNNTVSVVDPEHWIVRRNLLVGKGPEHLAMGPDGETLYTANVTAGTVSAVDLDRGAVTTTYEVGARPHGLAVSADGATLYATSRGDNRLVAIDLASGERQSRELAPAPYHLEVIGKTGKVYVSSRKKPKIWAVDGDTLEVTGTIAIEGRGHQMAVVP